MDDHTKINQEPKIATQIIDKALGVNGERHITINVFTVGTIHVHNQSPIQDNSVKERSRFQDPAEAKEELLAVLEGVNWVQKEAASLLRITPGALHHRILRLGGVKKLREERLTSKALEGNKD